MYLEHHTLSLGGTNNNTVDLYNQRSTNPNITTDRGIKIGKARVYSYGASDAPYTGGSTEFDLHLYDIQTFTILTVFKYTKCQNVAGIKS